MNVQWSERLVYTKKRTRRKGRTVARPVVQLRLRILVDASSKRRLSRVCVAPVVQRMVCGGNYGSAHSDLAGFKACSYEVLPNSKDKGRDLKGTGRGTVIDHMRSSRAS